MPDADITFSPEAKRDPRVARLMDLTLAHAIIHEDSKITPELKIAAGIMCQELIKLKREIEAELAKTTPFEDAYQACRIASDPTNAFVFEIRHMPHTKKPFSVTSGGANNILNASSDDLHTALINIAAQSVGCSL